MKCKQCGKSFELAYRVTREHKKTIKYCSYKCAGLARRGSHPDRERYRRPIADRFWEKVNTGAKTQCWNWIGTKNRDGYGMMSRSDGNGLWYRSNRLSWELNVGEIPQGMHVLHHCDNPSCVNPKHLFLGDQKANNADRDRKGRGGAIGSPGADRAGEKNGNVRITDEQVIEIIDRYLSGEISQESLAQEYGVRQSQISRIIRREQRKNVKDLC